MKLPQVSLRDLFWLLLASTTAVTTTLAQEESPRLTMLEAADLNLPIERKKLPERLRELEGKQVEIRGYVYAGSVYSRRFERFACWQPDQLFGIVPARG
jgi:hypothetical protein